MTTVYVVTSGEYSEYSIEALFSTQELAKQYIVRLGEENNYPSYRRIEEYDLDGTDVDWLNGKKDLYYVRLSLGSADVLSVEKKIYQPKEEEWEFMRLGERILFTAVMADTEERAVKVAMERRSMWLVNHP